MEISDFVIRELIMWAFTFFISWLIYRYQAKKDQRASRVIMGLIFVAVIAIGSREELMRLAHAMTSGQVQEAHPTNPKEIDDTLNTRAVNAIAYMGCEHLAESKGRMTEVARWARAADTTMLKYYDLCPSAPWCAKEMQGKAVSTLIAEMRLSNRKLVKISNARLAMIGDSFIDKQSQLCTEILKGLP